MRAVSTLTVIGAALYFVASSAAHSMGFGRITNPTQLGSPLNFAAAVFLEPDESLSRECVSAEVQSGDNKLHPSQIRTTLEGGPDTTDRSVRVTTNTIIDEPVVTVTVTVGCAAKITRRFVAFIDPPLINAPQASALPAPLPPQRNDSQVAPIVAIVQGEGPVASAPRRAVAPTRAERPVPARRQRPVPPTAAPRAPDTIEAAAPTQPKPPAKKRPPGTSRATTTAAAGSTGPRLKLEAAPLLARAASDAASAPTAAAALASAEAASAAALAKDQATLLAKERERIQVLEDGLNKLRTDSQATQKALATMQARLKEAESERYANPLVYGLAWLCALLALAVAGLLWRQSRARHSSQWWAAPAPAPAPAEPRAASGTSLSGALASAPQPLDDPVTGAGAFSIPTVIEDDEPHVTHAPVTQPAPFPPTAVMQVPPAPPVPEEPPRELSVEELIDLEQQAEFFIVLGQDEAAIELLMSHVRNDGGISPLPYLKLLEIYRRRGETEGYERIRERFNRRFNAYAPDWDADLQQGRSLVDYPDTIARLQGLWATPTRVMETLDASLFRRNKTDETFDLPAYRELLFLYSIARDLAEHGGSAPLADVDVLLPLTDDPNAEPISRLSATTGPGEFQHSDMMTMPLDLDVSMSGPEHPPTTARPRSPDHPFTATADAPAADSNFIDFDLDEPYTPPRKG